jgi:CHAT domain-containing protein
MAACESANRHPGSQNAYVGLAPKLVACGVPAVVAMQDMLPIDAAQKLTEDFYTYLFQHGVVDRALAQARLLLFKPSLKAWSTPVLYMRLKDGLLFDLENE